MNVQSIEAISSSLSAELGTLSDTRNTGFSAHIQAEFKSVNAKLIEAESSLQALATGKEENIHHVMLAMEDARMSFQLLAQVRNKVMDAYQEVMRMQV